MNLSSDNIEDVLTEICKPKVYVVTDVIGIGTTLVPKRGEAFIPSNVYGYLPVFKTEEAARLAFPFATIIPVNFT